MNTMAPGCCSAISPCSHQQRDPSTICDICAAAASLDEYKRDGGATLAEVKAELGIE